VPDADGPATPAVRTPAPAPAGYELRYRSSAKGSRWKRVAAVASYAEAVALIDAGGNWWIADVRNGTDGEQAEE